MDKLKLKPAKIPWSIAASASFLTTHFDEKGSLQHLTVVGNFWMHAGDQLSAGHVEVAAEPEAFRPAMPNEKALYQLVRITFTGLIEWICNPAYSESESIQESKYDKSLVPIRQAYEKWRAGIWNMPDVQRFKMDYLKDTGFDSSPRIYEVLNSPWLEASVAGGNELKHFMFVGDESVVEVLAKGWHWELGQPA